MPGLLGKTTNLSRDVVGQTAQTEREAMWGPIPGEIVSYDAAKGTATVQPLYKPRHNGKPVDMPQLLEVPVDLPRTGKSGITFPIPAGTKVMLTPAMRSMESYDEENDGAASDSRSFHLSDMRASIVGGDSLSDPLPNVDPDNMHIRFSPDGAFGIKGSPDGKIKIEGAEGNVYDLLAQVVELLGAATTTVSGGSSAGTWPVTQQPEFAEIAAKLRAMAL